MLINPFFINAGFVVILPPRVCQPNNWASVANLTHFLNVVSLAVFGYGCPSVDAMCRILDSDREITNVN